MQREREGERVSVAVTVANTQRHFALAKTKAVQSDLSKYLTCSVMCALPVSRVLVITSLGWYEEVEEEEAGGGGGGDASSCTCTCTCSYCRQLNS